MSQGALAIPAFRRLTVAWTFSNFGDSALYLTMAIWVKDLTGSDASAGLVFLFLGAPVFLAPLAGHLADRLSRRRLVVAANLIAAGGVLALVRVDSADDLWIVYAVTFGYGLLTHLTSACASGLIKDLVPDEHLAGANGLLSTIDQGLRLLSPLAGAALYAAFGGAAVAVLTAGTLVVAAAIVLSVRVRESAPTPTSDREPFAVEVTAGFRHIRRTPGLARVTLWLAVATAVTGFGNSTIFAAIERGLGRGAEFFAVLASVQGLGAIAGGVSSAAAIRRLGERRTLAIGLMALGIGTATALTTSTAFMLVGFSVIGAGIPWAYVSHATLRQRATPGPLQGRVAAASNLAFNGPQTAGTAFGAAMIAVIDYRLLVAAMAATVVASGILVLGAAPVPPADGATPVRPPYERHTHDREGVGDFDGQCVTTRDDTLITASLDPVGMDPSGCRRVGSTPTGVGESQPWADAHPGPDGYV